MSTYFFGDFNQNLFKLWTYSILDLHAYTVTHKTFHVIEYKKINRLICSLVYSFIHSFIRVKLFFPKNSGL